jgi:predicted nuclease of predicted toxin-antitoxin system
VTYWLDAHLDPDVAPWLGVRYRLIAKHVREVGLRNAKDKVIFEAARRFAPVVILSKDEDLVDLVRHHGAPPQIVWIRLGNQSTIQLQASLSGCFDAVLAELAAGAACVEITPSGIGRVV